MVGPEGGALMAILVVGSVAYDTVETPFGRAEKVLGGSCCLMVSARAVPIC